MNKFDMVCKIAIIGLLVLVAYQQNGIKNELGNVSAQAESIRGDLVMRGQSSEVISVKVVNEEKAPVPISIIEPTTRVGFGGKAVSVSVER